MIAAVAAAREGCKVSLYEKNEKLGKKLFITGKGRCNVTNACDMEELFGAVVTNRKFLFSSFYGFTNEDVMELFEEAGLPLKIERGNRVFPCSDHSSDVIAALERMMRQAGVKVYLRQEIKGLAVRRGYGYRSGPEGLLRDLSGRAGRKGKRGAGGSCDPGYGRCFLPVYRIHRGRTCMG